MELIRRVSTVQVHQLEVKNILKTKVRAEALSAGYAFHSADPRDGGAKRVVGAHAFTSDTAATASRIR